MKRVAVIVPLKPGGRETAKLLVADGPPFALEETGIDRHEVFVTDDEVVFVFEGPNPRVAVEQLLGDADVWRAAVAWRSCAAGRPRVADEAFAWERPPRPMHVPGL